MQTLARIAAALALGSAGGALFQALSLPLPWMLGALFVTMVASVAGMPIAGPTRLRPVVVAVIGVLLGSRFTPEFLAEGAQVMVTLAILMAYLVLVALVVVPFYRVVGRQDWQTAYFSGMPGGLVEMIELGEARGAHVPSIVLAHSLRIALTVALIAVLIRVVLGHPVGATGATSGAEPMLGLTDAALLAGCAVVGSVLGPLCRLPAPTFLGPLILSAAVHLAGLTDSAPPGLLVLAAQVVLGTILGCRFQGIAAPTLLRAGVISLGATLLTLGLAVLGALAMTRLTGVSLEQGILALAPGGLTEMGLIALAIQADAAFVAVHHVVRILIVLVIAPRFAPAARPGQAAPLRPGAD